MKKFLKIFLTVLTSIIIFILVINIIPPKKVIASNPFITDGLPLICAHRGGKDLNPENTLKAYKACVNEYNVDILETDLYLTKDKFLVLNHDSSINRTTDVEVITNSTDKYYIKDHTLDELKQFNYGYNFKQNDNYPYRDLVEIDNPNRKSIIEQNDLSIITIDELFEFLYEDYPDMLFIVEIKNSGELGFEACQILNNLLEQKYHKYKNRIVIGTFNSEVENHLKDTYPSLYRGASTNAVIKYVVTQMLKVNLFAKQDFICLQIPTDKYGINLTRKTYIKRAHRKNVAVQYWTINEKSEMRLLIERGCDAIMTDNPVLLNEVLEEYR